MGRSPRVDPARCRALGASFEVSHGSFVGCSKSVSSREERDRARAQRRGSRCGSGGAPGRGSEAHDAARASVGVAGHAVREASEADGLERDAERETREADGLGRDAERETRASLGVTSEARNSTCASVGVVRAAVGAVVDSVGVSMAAACVSIASVDVARDAEPKARAAMGNTKGVRRHAERGSRRCARRCPEGERPSRHDESVRRSGRGPSTTGSSSARPRPSILGEGAFTTTRPRKSSSRRNEGGSSP